MYRPVYQRKAKVGVLINRFLSFLLALQASSFRGDSPRGYCVEPAESKVISSKLNASSRAIWVFHIDVRNSQSAFTNQKTNSSHAYLSGQIF